MAAHPVTRGVLSPLVRRKSNVKSKLHATAFGHQSYSYLKIFRRWTLILFWILGPQLVRGKGVYQSHLLDAISWILQTLTNFGSQPQDFPHNFDKGNISHHVSQPNEGCISKPCAKTLGGQETAIPRLLHINKGIFSEFKRMYGRNGLCRLPNLVHTFPRPYLQPDIHGVLQHWEKKLQLHLQPRSIPPKAWTKQLGKWKNLSGCCLSVRKNLCWETRQRHKQHGWEQECWTKRSNGSLGIQYLGARCYDGTSVCVLQRSGAAKRKLFTLRNGADTRQG